MEDYDALIYLVKEILNKTQEELKWDPKKILMKLRAWFYCKQDAAGVWTLSNKKRYEADLTFTAEHRIYDKFEILMRLVFQHIEECK